MRFLNEQTGSSIPSSLRPYLEEIAARLLSGHAAVMIGSGFSKNTTPFSSVPPFPDWPELGNRLYQRLHGREPGPTTNYLQFPVLAHEIEAAFGRPALDQMLRDEIPDLMHEPSLLHVDLLTLRWSGIDPEAGICRNYLTFTIFRGRIPDGVDAPSRRHRDVPRWY